MFRCSGAEVVGLSDVLGAPVQDSPVHQRRRPGFDGSAYQPGSPVGPVGGTSCFGLLRTSPSLISQSCAHPWAATIRVFPHRVLGGGPPGMRGSPGRPQHRSTTSCAP